MRKKKIWRAEKLSAGGENEQMEKKVIGVKKRLNKGENDQMDEKIIRWRSE